MFVIACDVVLATKSGDLFALFTTSPVPNPSLVRLIDFQRNILPQLTTAKISCP